jgi:hypothetical protein
MITVFTAMVSGCGNKMPTGEKLKSLYVSHEPAFNRLIAMLKEDGAFNPSPKSQGAALMLNPLGARDSRDLKLNDSRREEYKKGFDEIGLQYSALVFTRPESVIFVIATKGLAIGGGGTTRGIAYVVHPEENPGFRIVRTEHEAESSSYGGADLVPIEGNWYLYYMNPS